MRRAPVRARRGAGALAARSCKGGGSHNVKAGESVRWLPRRRASSLLLPGNDCWVFDRSSVLCNHFNGDGEMTGEELVTDAGVVHACVSAFEAIWERATPHEEYRPV